ncbi:hypothetical protein HQQ88_08240 [Curtobacterium sp. VKM Ac-2861]|uniref:hypothetical protein n=1 Tax=Curtobacterium sp. VKM Ac-2861 TaxID=2739016 RepID=UPI0015633F79|nr:hypothetical protein [Curtobacterium sp. VKM Ac-2861]
MFDLETLTLGEVAKVEEISRMSIGSIADEEKPKGRALAALAYVIKRREVPAYSFDQALNLPLGEAEALLGVSDDEEHAEDPTAPESSPASELSGETATAS